jgi:hypothetical protein
VQPVGFLPHVQLFKPASDVCCGGRTSGFVKVSEDDDRAFIVEAGGDRAANTLRGAGDDARLIIQSWHDGLETESR